MIKLPHDLYDHFINDYIALLLRKGFDKEGFFALISEVANFHEDYRIPDEQKDDFVRTVLVNPFSKEALTKYSLLKDYFQYVIGEQNPNPIAGIEIVKGNDTFTFEKVFDYSNFIEKVEKKRS